MKKRVLSLFLAAVTMLSVLSPAYAAEAENGGQPASEQNSPVPEQDEQDGFVSEQSGPAPELGDPGAEQDSTVPGSVPGDPQTEDDGADEEDDSADEEDDSADHTEPPADPGSQVVRGDGWQLVEGKWYYYRGGAPLTGWLNLWGTWYYLNPSDEGKGLPVGAMVTGWLELSGTKYYLNSSGAMVTGWQWLQDKDEGEPIAFATSEPAPQEEVQPIAAPSVELEIAASGSSHWYWFDANGAMKKGWVKLRGIWYYLNPSDEEEGLPEGAMATDWLELGGTGGTTYYLNSSGAMVTGWRFLKDKDAEASHWYWFEASGAMKKGGWVNSRGAWYYLEPDNGKMATGWRELGNTKYYLDPNKGGAMVTGWRFLKDENGENSHWYWFDASGAMKTGWQWIKGAWYYLNPTESDLPSLPEGAMAIGWLTLGGPGGTKYYLDSSGAMATGWRYLLDEEGVEEPKTPHWYWFDASGAMKTGWQWIKGAWYYLNPTAGDLPVGAMRTNWLDLNGTKYYLRGSGAMVTGWEYIEGGWRYFDRSGAQLFGWKVINGAWYYLKPDTGIMLSGWQKIDEKWYYLDPNNGGAMASRPTFINKKMYMIQSDGSLQTGGTVRRCNRTYNVDENGVIQGYITDAGWKAINVLNSIGWNLWAAYKWAAGLPYYDRWHREGSVEAYANYGFRNRCGNCFVMNSCLYEMAKMMGYDVWMTNGGVQGSSGVAPHGWCEIKIGNTWYVFDSNFHNETGLNGYQIRYGQHNTWRYVIYGYFSG